MERASPTHLQRGSRGERSHCTGRAVQVKGWAGITVARACGREFYDAKVPFHRPEEVAVAGGRRSTGRRRYVGKR
jgi:hypothetical protein